MKKRECRICLGCVHLLAEPGPEILVERDHQTQPWDVQVCQFNNVSCGTFQAVTQRGYLTILTQNVGTIAADYQLQVNVFKLL